MKMNLALASMWLGLSLCTTEAQVIHDPFLDYYKAIRSGASMGDYEPHYTSHTQIYYFKADFTGNGRKTIFITDDESAEGAGDFFEWSAYYPLGSGGYEKLAGGLSASLDGPSFIGYVAEIKGYGIVQSGRHVVSVQYLKHGWIDITFLGKHEEAEQADYPKYFASPTKLQIKQITLGQLEKKYGDVGSTSGVTPGSK